MQKPRIGASRIANKEKCMAQCSLNLEPDMLIYLYLNHLIVVIGYPPTIAMTLSGPDVEPPDLDTPIVEARKLERGFRRISARIASTLLYLQGHEDNDVPTFWLLISAQSRASSRKNSL